MMLKSLGSVAVIGLIPVFTGAIPLNITNDLYPRLSIPETPDLNKQCFALPGVRNPGVVSLEVSRLSCLKENRV
jgi:hypothetical protein